MTKQDMLTRMSFDMIKLDQWRYWICEMCNSKVHDKDNLIVHKIDGVSKIVCKDCVVRSTDLSFLHD